MFKKLLNSRSVFSALALAIWTGSATAGVIDFRHSSVEAIDGASSMTLSDDGRTVTLMTASGVFNRTGASFGINAPGAGDAASAIDGGRGIEALTASFDGRVGSLLVQVSGFGRGDRGRIRAGSLFWDLNSTGTYALDGLTLAVGELLEVAYLAGNGFSLDRFTFRPLPLAVPTPPPGAPPVNPPGTPPTGTGAPHVAAPQTLPLLTLALFMLAARRRGWFSV